MKKNCFISALMLLLPMLACALTPAELAGTWTSELVELINEGANSVSLQPYYTINQDGTFTDNSTMRFKESQMGMTIEYRIHSEISGTYSIEGDNVELIYDYANGSFICAKEDIEISGEIPSEQKSEIINSIAQMLNSMVIPQLKNEGVGEPKETWNNVKVTSSTLSYEIDGREVILNKK